MKKIIVSMAMAMVIAFASVSSAGVFGQDELRKTDAGYEIDTWGANSEVYEFTPKTAPWKTCVVYLTDNIRAAAMQCFDKPNAHSIILKLRGVSK